MSSNVDVNKQFAMQNVSMAVRLDSNGDSMDAYRKYLESIEFMSHQLFLDASQCTGPLATDSALKFISLCRKCLERADDLIKTLPVHSAKAESEFRATNQVLPNLTLPAHLSSMRSLPRPEGQISVKEMSPIELAQWQNDYLVSMHKARIEKLTPNNQMTANLSLSLQRRMMENMAIAQQRQIALEKKKEERLKRLQAEADRRFNCHAGMSPDELGRRKLYTEILEYEQDVKWLMELRKKVPETCREPSFVVACVRGILGDCDHPLTRLMYGYQKSVCQRALDATNLAISSPQASTPLSSSTGFSYDPNLNTTCSSSSQMDAVSLRNDKSGSIGSSSKHGLEQITATLVSDVQAYLEKLETMFVVMYEDFDDEEIRYTLRDLLEDIFFQPIWSFILSLFRQSTLLKEQTMDAVMRDKLNASPADLGVSEKFTLCRSLADSAHPQKSEAPPPYQAVVNSFQSVFHVPSPTKKLDQIVQSSQLICQCIDEFYAPSASSSPQMGADEMLPVLSYIILKTEQPRLVTECYALMEFIDESSLMGERGYCLTSVMTAIDFLLTLSSKSSPDV